MLDVSSELPFLRSEVCRERSHPWSKIGTVGEACEGEVVGVGAGGSRLPALPRLRYSVEGPDLNSSLRGGEEPGEERGKGEGRPRTVAVYDASSEAKG